MAEPEKEVVTEEEIDTEILQDEKPIDEFPWAESIDERRRSFIFVQMSDCTTGLSIVEIDGKLLVENMNMIYSWIKDGAVPTKEHKEPKLKSVPKNV